MGKDDPNTYTNAITRLGANNRLKILLESVITVSDDEGTRLAEYKTPLNITLLEQGFTEESLRETSFADLLLFINYRFNVIDLHIGIAILLLQSKANSWVTYSQSVALLTTLTSEDEKLFYRQGGGPVFFQTRLNRLKDLNKDIKLDEVSKLQEIRNQLAHPLFKNFRLDGDDGQQTRRMIARAVLGSFGELSGIKQIVISHLEPLSN